MGQAMPMTSTVPTAERLLKIRGGNVLRGEVLISGAKNAALKAMAATLLTSDEVVLNNVPMLADVLSMADLLRAFGAEVEVDRKLGRVQVRAQKSPASPRPRTSSVRPALSSPPVRCWRAVAGVVLHARRRPDRAAADRCPSSRFSAHGTVIEHRDDQVTLAACALRAHLHGFPKPYWHREPADGRHPRLARL